MFIFEISWPGTFLQSNNPEESREIETLLYSLNSQFSEANIILNLFAQSQEDASLTWEINTFPETIEQKRQQWSKGNAPSDYVKKLPVIYAKAFISEVFMFGRILSSLKHICKENGDIDTDPYRTIIREQKRFGEYFVHLQGVRDSIHHVDERIQGKSRGRDLDAKTINTESMQIGPGNLVIGNLHDNKYGTVMANGQYGLVEISEKSLHVLQKCLQNILSCFDWRGPERHYPM
jgi:hypothetical protein